MKTMTKVKTLLLFIQDEVGVMPDHSNMFWIEQYCGGVGWEEYEEEEDFE